MACKNPPFIAMAFPYVACKIKRAAGTVIHDLPLLHVPILLLRLLPWVLFLCSLPPPLPRVPLLPIVLPLVLLAGGSLPILSIRLHPMDRLLQNPTMRDVYLNHEGPPIHLLRGSLDPPRGLRVLDHVLGDKPKLEEVVAESPVLVLVAKGAVVALVVHSNWNCCCVKYLMAYLGRMVS